MEPRIVLSADPVIVGAWYLEGDSGQDNLPDHFEVTFQGGAETTQLTQFVINGDQDGSGTLTQGDVFFDIPNSGVGVGGSHDFIFNAQDSSGLTADDVLSVNVSDDGLTLTVELQNFEAGDLLAFTIDVDEVETFSNDVIASGVEFEASTFTSTFTDENFNLVGRELGIDVDLPGGFEQTQTTGVFYNNYDALFAEGGSVVEPLDLDGDNETGQSDRTAGALEAFNLEPKPISLSGTVYQDNNLNWTQDANEDGIADVRIDLQRLNSNGNYETVASTTTDANGNYEFGNELGLMPGTFRLIETQPNGFLDVGAQAGQVDGQDVGNVVENQLGNDNIIANIEIPLGNTVATNYDFKEIRPVSLSGNVFHDRNDDGVRDPGEEGIADVVIRITRVGAKDGATLDPFESTPPIFIRTDANGQYSVDGLPPGIYEVIEINNYPPNENPLQGFVDGQDSLGRIDGTQNGQISNDRFSLIELCAGEDGVEYNFGELRPASISGFVSVSTPEGDCLDPSDPNHMGIAGVTIQLFGENGELLQETLTNQNGFYEFADLRPGTYSVVEVQPNGFLDGAEHIGTVDGQEVGLAASNDRINQITLRSDSAGTNYNFCEHRPAEIHGTVFHDFNDNGVLEGGEQRLGGVTLELLGANDELIATTTTNAQGEYWFSNLTAGTYSVRELQPVSFTDGIDSVGTIDGLRVGELENDLISNIELKFGQQGVDYNFAEIRLGSISGMVHGDVNGDCTFNPSDGDLPLEGVVLRLFNADGDVVGQTVTDAAGNYSFDGLRPGEYTIREFTPDGLIDGDERIGTVAGESSGRLANGRLADIFIGSGQAGINYDFCEHLPAEIHGTVFHDLNNDGLIQSREAGIGNVTVELFDASGELVASTTTDANGDYWFTGLIAGTYSIRETQPGNFVDGIDTVGRVDGVTQGDGQNDAFVNVSILGGQKGVNYNFAEIRLASISGFVHSDLNGDCVLQTSAGDQPLSGVALQLLNDSGQVIATTTTGQDGSYAFDNLLPGEYSVRQIQPEGLFNGEARVGDGGGNAGENLISGIVVDSGQIVEQYNFCEHPGSEIHGRVFADGPGFATEDGILPVDFRDQRDGVFTEGVDMPLAGVRLFLYYYIDPDSNSLTPRPVTISDVLPGAYPNLESTGPNTPLSVLTNENGEYWFAGLREGNYLVLQEQPEGFIDANDIPGTTTGFSINSSSQTAPESLNQFSQAQVLDTVSNIRVNVAQASFENNFTEVFLASTPEPPVIFPPIPEPPLPPGNPTTPGPGIAGRGGLAGALPVASTELIATSRTVSFQAQTQTGPAYTWHLSIVNGGQPPAEGEARLSNSVWQQVSFLGENDWQRFEMGEATWTFTEARTVGDIVVTGKTTQFGMLGGVPLAGDFDGDGSDELAVFNSGYWMIDLNHNGQWDDADLLATLGDADDRPVVGDWDGDGKDDIGIYGPIWERDPVAIELDPGLPNPDNFKISKPKNVPPVEQDATNGARVMKLTSFGQQRVDVVDHVFGTGDETDTPIAGDWNGNGIRSIGYFNAGAWQFDVNGDGIFDSQDATASFGQIGDTPLVGDFNGDGIEEIAVYRAGTWLIDTNGNLELDATDLTFQLGGADDVPVVGDWNGDGIDEPALYQHRADAVQGQ